MNTQNTQEKPKGIFHALMRAGLIVVNVLIIAVVLIVSTNYFTDQLDVRYENAENNFASTVSVMEKVAYGYLKSTQTFCDNWASFVTDNDMTEEEAMDFLRQINTDPEIMCHVMDYDTLQGMSTNDNTGGLTDYPISYVDCGQSLKDIFIDVKDCESPGTHPHITHSYRNPVNGVSSVGFCHDIEILDDSGDKVHKLLIRVIPSYMIREQIIFPAEYSLASMAMIDTNGEYIIRSNLSVDQNFFEYIDAANEIEGKEFRNIVLSNKSGILELKNLKGEDAFYSFCRMDFNENWLLIGYIKKADLEVKPIDMTIVLIVIFGFLILIAVDGSYLVVLTRKLKASMEETKEANSAKTRFLSSMSHDIRTPMNAIVGMTAIAGKHIDDKDQVLDCLQKITLASHHLLTLINDILDLSKIESGKFTLNPVVFSLAESAGNLVNIVQPQVKEKGLSFDAHVHNIKHEYIYADEVRINQVFINLLSNAVKYTPPGGEVRLDIEEQPTESPDRVKLIYTVSDNGIGMSEEFMKTMYSQFTRSSDNKAQKVQGTGLGLAITKQMVDLMKGTIEAKSRLNEGTTFRVEIEIPVAEKLTDSVMLPPLNILVVDDDEAFLQSSAETLVSLGVDVDTAGSGKEAVAMVEKRHDAGNDYPCVILDWKMPDMDGIETAKAIREKVGDDVPIILISSYDWTEIEEEASKAGVNGFLCKPMFRSTIYRKINDIFKFDKSLPLNEDDNGEDLKGMHLLIAEDNDLNWEIIETMLGFSDITAERAENGQICVDMINAAPDGKYQAILMDVQMPVLGGREATKIIRKSEREYVKNIPIIAMTADAFTEDIISCLDAGMNSHVSKPLDMKRLFKALRDVVKPKQ